MSGAVPLVRQGSGLIRMPLPCLQQPSMPEPEPQGRSSQRHGLVTRWYLRMTLRQEQRVGTFYDTGAEAMLGSVTHASSPRLPSGTILSSNKVVA